MAGRLRGLEAGAGRQRRERAAPARRLRRGARLLLPGAAARPAGRSAGMGAPARPARPPRRGVARAGRRHLGDPRRATAFRSFQGDGLGCVRPRRPHRRGARLRGSGRPLAGAARRDPPGRLRPRLRSRARLLHAVVRLEGARREPPAAAARRLPAGDRPADPRHDRGDRARAAPRRLRAPLPHARERSGRAAAAARECSCPARSGSATATSCSGGTTRRTSCSGGWSISATTSGSLPRSTTRRPAACSGTSPRRSRTSRS